MTFNVIKMHDIIVLDKILTNMLAMQKVDKN